MKAYNLDKLLLKHNGQWEILSLNKSATMGNSSNLGITNEKGKIKFDPGFGQKEFKEYVTARADHVPSTGYAVGDVDDFNWHYDPEYSLDKVSPIKGGPEGWKSWFKGEMLEWEYGHGDERKNHFQNWAKNPTTKPAIIIQGIDNKDHIWDAHHRIAMAFIKDMKSIPAIYGTRKTK